MCVFRGGTQGEGITRTAGDFISNSKILFLCRCGYDPQCLAYQYRRLQEDNCLLLNLHAFQDGLRFQSDNLSIVFKRSMYVISTNSSFFKIITEDEVCVD